MTCRDEFNMAKRSADRDVYSGVTSIEICSTLNYYPAVCGFTVCSRVRATSAILHLRIIKHFSRVDINFLSQLSYCQPGSIMRNSTRVCTDLAFQLLVWEWRVVGIRSLSRLIEMSHDRRCSVRDLVVVVAADDDAAAPVAPAAIDAVTAAAVVALLPLLPQLSLLLPPCCSSMLWAKDCFIRYY